MLEFLKSCSLHFENVAAWSYAVDPKRSGRIGERPSVRVAVAFQDHLRSDDCTPRWIEHGTGHKCGAEVGLGWVIFSHEERSRHARHGQALRFHHPLLPLQYTERRKREKD